MAFPTIQTMMKRLLFWCVLAAVGVVFTTTTLAWSAGPQPLDFHLLSNVQIDNPVEQQTDWPFPADQSLWVINPTSAASESRCAWDVDDHWQKGSTNAYLDAFSSVSTTECLIADADPFWRTVNGTTAWWSTNAPRRITVEMISPSPAVTIAVCFQPHQRCFSATPVYVSSDHAYRSVSCVTIGYSDDDPALSVVPGSNGGVGVVSYATVTATNTSSRKVAKLGITVLVQGGYVASTPCSDPSPWQTSYPFSWAT
jgi:hypothetical protein